jgi:hypothetical protein
LNGCKKIIWVQKILQKFVKNKGIFLIFVFLPNSNSHQGQRLLFTIIVPSDDDIGKLLDARKDNI